MLFLRWIKDNKLSFIIFCILSIATLYTIVQTLANTDTDLKIAKVHSEYQDDAFLYRVKLKATGKITSSTELHAIFEDGTEEMIQWGPEQSRMQVDLKSPKRLEYLLVSNMEIPEKDLQNNGKQLPLWSDELTVYTGYSVPEYTYLTDSAGRFWLAAAGRTTPESRPALTVTVLSPDGKILIDNRQLSAENWFNRYPVLREIDNQIHLVWSGYANEGESRQLFHTAFNVANDGTFSQSVITTVNAAGYSLLRPVASSDDFSNPLILVEVANELKSGFYLYQLTEHGLTKVGPVHDASGEFLASEMIRDIEFQTAPDGTYHLVWTQQHYYTNIYYARLTADGRMVTPAISLTGNSSNSRINQLSVVPYHDKIYYFWSYTSMHQTNIFHIYYMISDFDGQILRDRTILFGPSLTPLRDVSVALDENGNFDMTWIDGRYGTSKPMLDIVFHKISPELEAIVPSYRVTANSVTEMTPLLTNQDNVRTLTWKTYDDGKYTILMKSTRPQLVSALKGQRQFKENVQTVWDVVWATLASLGLQIFFVFPLNFAALATALIFMFLFAINKLRNNLITWGSILLCLLLAKFYSFHAMANQLGQFHLIKIPDCYKISLLTLALALISYYIISRFSKNKASNELRFLHVMLWFLLDSFTLLLVDNLLMLS